MAREILQSSQTTDETRLDDLIRRTISPPSTRAEIAILSGCLSDQREQLKANPASIEQLAPQPVEGIDRIELAAWTSALSVLE
jgi:hypothetical protein